MSPVLPPNSFYLVSYPRSGNTWLINCLSMLLDGVKGEAYTQEKTYTEHHGELGPDFNFRCEPRRRPDQPICIKSHDDLVTFATRHPPGPIVYIARDARDCLLSFYFFQQAYPTLNAEVVSYTRIAGQEVLISRGGVDPVFEDESFANFLRREAPLWLAHVESARRDASVCFTSYEQMKSGFHPTLARIAAFLKIPCACPSAEVEKVYHTGFAQVFTGSTRDFFRRGQVGDWKNWYSLDHARVVDDLIGPGLLELGFERDPEWARHYTPVPAARKS